MEISADEPSVAGSPSTSNLAPAREIFWNLPNTITVLRTSAVPVLLLLPVFDDGRLGSLVIAWCFIAAALTDILDGWLARRGQQVTQIGKLLDPLADKLLVSTALVVLVAVGRIPTWAVWMVVVIVGRELLVTGLRGFSEAQGRPFAADVFGKIKTITQMVTASVIMLCVAHAPPDETRSLFAGAGEVLLWLTIVTTGYSGLNYLYKARAVLLDRD